MKTYEIREEGCTFAKIEARSADSALRKAEKQFPRRAKDYNGYTGPVTWRAWRVDGEETAQRVVTVK